MSNKFFVTTHPKNSYDITVEYDEDYRLVNAVYTSDDEEIEMSDSIKSYLQVDINNYVKP
jgi:spore coat polysaccharide biosynthesis protein SpsF (cytidylyltransferase family)